MPKRLDQKVDAEELFIRADGLLISARIIQLYNLQVGAVCAPGTIMCASCAVELYMKVLAQIERDEPPLWGHQLNALARDLSAKSYARIRKAWLNLNAEPIKLAKAKHPEWTRFPTTFEIALMRSAKAFIDWRYGDTGAPKSWCLDQITQELRNIIIELKPEWRPSAGARVILNPETDIAEAKRNGLVGPMDWSKLDNKPAAVKVQIRRSPDL